MSLPNSMPQYQTGAIVAPIYIPTPNPLPNTPMGFPDPFYTPTTSTAPQTTTGGTCNCQQSSTSCNCPTPTPTPILSPTSTPTPTDNKKYMYIAGGLIIAFFIFRKK